MKKKHNNVQGVHKKTLLVLTFNIYLLASKKQNTHFNGTKQKLIYYTQSAASNKYFCCLAKKDQIWSNNGTSSFMNSMSFL